MYVCMFIMLYKVVLTFTSVDEILKSDHSNTSYRAVLSCGTVHSAVKGGSNFWVCGWYPKEWPFKYKCKLLSYRAVLSCGTVHYAVQGGSNFNVTIQMKATGQYFPVVTEYPGGLPLKKRIITSYWVSWGIIITYYSVHWGMITPKTCHSVPWGIITPLLRIITSHSVAWGIVTSREDYHLLLSSIGDYHPLLRIITYHSVVWGIVTSREDYHLLLSSIGDYHPLSRIITYHSVA